MIATGPKSAGITPATRPTIGRMPSYEPVDLSAACNAGVEVLGDEPGDVPLGRVDLRGLPFLIGSGAAVRGAVLPAARRPGVGRDRPAGAAGDRRAPAARAGRTSRSRRRADRRGVCVSPGRRRGRGRAHPGAVRDPGGAAGLGSSAVPRRHRHQRPQPAAFRGQLGRGRGSPGGARHGMARPGTTCGAGKTLIRNDRSNGSSSSRAARDSSSPASPPATLMSTRSSARRPARSGSCRRTGGTASSTSTWTGAWRPIRSRCPARTTGPAGERPRERPRMRRSPRCRRPPSRSGRAATSSAGCAGATWNATAGRTPARSRSSWRKAAATGCMSASSTTRPGGRCRAGSISARPRGFPTSRTATTITSRRISAAGITTSAVTSAWASAATHISTAPARDGCREATSSWTSRADSSTSRSGRPCGSSRASET